MSAPETRHVAMAAAERGWAVFPCRPGRKFPAVPDHREDECQRRGRCRDGHLGWEQLACADPERVARYWPAGANIGIACGPSGLVVVDLDVDDGDQADTPAGARHFDQLHREHGQAWADTLTVCTPRQGWHLYYSAIPGRQIRNSASRLARHIDTRASGGYVIGAGSVVGDRPYRLVLDRPVVQLPGWLADLLDPPRHRAPNRVPASPQGPVYGRLRGVVEHVLGGQPGDRNGRLHWAACRAAEMVAAGQLDRAAAEAALLQAALDAGLRGGEAEARRTIASGMRTAAA